MHWKRIGGHMYCYESVRIGGRITSRCRGRGLPGCLTSMFMEFQSQRLAEDRAARRRAKRSAERRAEAAKEKAAEIRKAAGRGEAFGRELEEYGREVDAAVAAALTALGFHRPKRGAWRRRMGEDVEKGARARSEIGELIVLARKGDRIADARLAEMLVDRAAVGAGDLEEVAAINMLDNLPSAKYSRRHRQDVEARMEKLRRDLAPPGSGPVVELLAARAALDWLHVAFWEQWCSLVWADLKGSVALGRTWNLLHRNLDRATARYQKSLLAVARARRIALPVIVGQINVALPGANQLNQGRAELGVVR